MKKSSFLVAGIIAAAILSQSLAFGQSNTASEQNVKQESINEQKAVPSDLNTKSNAQPVKKPTNAELKSAELQKQTQKTETDPALKQSTQDQQKPAELQKQTQKTETDPALKQSTQDQQKPAEVKQETQKVQNNSSATEQLSETELKDLKEKEAQKAQQNTLKKSSEAVPSGNTPPPVKKSKTKNQAAKKTTDPKTKPDSKPETNEVKGKETPKPVKVPAMNTNTQAQPTPPQKQTEAPGQAVKENTPAAKTQPVNMKMPVAEPAKK